MVTALTQEERKPLGKILVEKGLVKEDDLWHALVAQQASGARLGRILLGQGSINSFKLHQTIAEHYGVEFANLDKEPVESDLLEKDERKNYVALEAVPWKKEGNKIVIATTDICDDVKLWAYKKYKDNHRFAITSPYDVFWTVQKNFAGEDDFDSRNLLWQENPQKSAKSLVVVPKWSDAVVLSLLITAAYFYFGSFLKAFFITVNIFYFFTMLFKIMLFAFGGIKNRFLSEQPGLTQLNEKELPIYTILVPLYKEKQRTVLGLVSAIRRLNYPKAKLDVKLIVEEDDLETIDVIKNIKCESIFEIIRVPHSMPRTKPKALNYAIKFARGEYATIYDAEDVPEPDQLKKVIHKFKNSSEEVACVQARLNYYNRNENTITRMFAIEYSSWFDFMLPGLEKMAVPIPLGGTSNHFPIRILRQIYAWDPYNVTEDADIGIRLAEQGYKTRMVNSITYEECPIGIYAWMRQRSRWIKGYLQTYIVHMRNPLSLYKNLGFRGFFGFQFFVGAPALIFLSIPFTAVASGMLYYNSYGLHEYFVGFAFANLYFGIMLQSVFALIVIKQHKWWNMLPYCLVFPFYWLLHSLASFKAVFDLIKAPHYWEKTEHGVTKVLFS